jgi:GntR family transcriptional regulator
MVRMCACGIVPKDSNTACLYVCLCRQSDIGGTDMNDVSIYPALDLQLAYAEWANPPLDRKSPLPLYAQIKQRLIGMILRWNKIDRRFYSDEQLCECFCVSRDTVRQAVAELVNEGFLTRSRGLGTFITASKLEERFGPGMDFQKQWAAHGTPTRSTLLIFERRPANEEVAAALELPDGAPILFIKRVRAAANVPVAIDYRFLPAELVTDWSRESVRGSPLHLLWQTVNLDSGEFAIEAGVAGPEEVEYLHLASGAPVLIRTLRYRACAGRLVMTGHTVHRGDLVRYSLNVPLVRNASVIGSSGVHDD